MAHKIRSVVRLALFAPLFLAGCGEGWEMKLVDDVFPYGNERTAGSGVAYVRAKLLPEKGTTLAPSQSDVNGFKPLARTDQVLEKVDRAFNASVNK